MGSWGNMSGLFREEVLQARRGDHLGAISLAMPLGFLWWALLATTLVAAIILLLAFGHYTRREAVSGQLQISAGLLTLSPATMGHASRQDGQDGPLADGRSVNAAGGTVLRAPSAGVVSALLVKTGQSVTPGQPLLSVQLKGSKLEAQLLVPSNAIAYVRLGSRVVLRYKAFPYQKFGLQYGKVIHVSHSALTPTEVATLTEQPPLTSAPLYPVLVALDSQTIDVDGRGEQLSPGMALTADIPLGRTALWAWAFDPLQGLRPQFSTHGATAE